MKFNKKGSLEISIQAIVIIVLAMTLLGLGLGFVRNMFKNISGTTEDVTDQVKQKVLDDLITGDKKISFPKTEVVIDKGGSVVLTVGIRNKENTILNYDIGFTAISDSEGNPLASAALDSWFQIARPTPAGWDLNPAESHVRNIRINVPKGAASGSYVLTFDVIDLGNTGAIYDQKDFFIVVRG